MKSLPLLILTLAAGVRVYGDVVIVDPASYPPAGTVLTTIVPQVTLSVADSTNAINTSETINSHQEGTDFNDIWDFAQGVIGFYNDNKRLRIDFNVPVTAIQIQFLSDVSGSNTATGTLNVYDSAGDDLGQYTTAALKGPASETMEVSGLSSNAAYAVATSNSGGFGRLTDLQVTTATTPTPEPGALLLCLAGLPVCLARRRPS